MRGSGNYDRKKKIQSSVWRVVLLCQFLVLAGNLHFFVVAGNFDYDRKKKDTVVCWWEIGSFFVVAGNFHYDRKKKDTLRPEKKKIQSSVCWVRGSGDYDRKKKRYSRLSVGCAVLAITTGKKKDTVVCLTGCAVVFFFVVAGNFDYEIFITTGKKSMSVFLVAIVIFVLVQLELNLIQIH